VVLELRPGIYLNRRPAGRLTDVGAHGLVSILNLGNLHVAHLLRGGCLLLI